MNHDELDEEERQKIRRKAKVRFAVAFAIAALVTGVWLYVRYGVTKSNLGGPCKYAMNCLPDAPQCMRPSEDMDGVCSRPCEADAGDCAPGVRCVSIELDDVRDEREMPWKGGYCFPQSFIDAKKKRKHAGAP